MALNAAQKAMVARLTRETVPTIEALPRLLVLTPEEESLLSDDIDTWEGIQNSHVIYKGDGVDFNNKRKRIEIFYRVRTMLGLPFIPYDFDVVGGYSMNVGHTVRW